MNKYKFKINKTQTAKFKKGDKKNYKYLVNGLNELEKEEMELQREIQTILDSYDPRVLMRATPHNMNGYISEFNVFVSNNSYLDFVECSYGITYENDFLLNVLFKLKLNKVKFINTFMNKRIEDDLGWYVTDVPCEIYNKTLEAHKNKYCKIHDRYTKLIHRYDRLKQRIG